MSSVFVLSDAGIAVVSRSKTVVIVACFRRFGDPCEDVEFRPDQRPADSAIMYSTVQESVVAQSARSSSRPTCSVIDDRR